MDDPGRVEVREAVERLCRDVEEDAHREEPPRLEDVGEARPVDELQDHVVRPGARRAEVVEDDDVPVREAARDLRLAEEPLPRVRVVPGGRPEHLDDARLVQEEVPDAVDRAHPPLAELLEDLVRPADDRAHPPQD